MKGAKITKRVLTVVRITGIVLVLISLVLGLYASINTNAYWSKTSSKGERIYKISPWESFSSDMAAFDVNTNLFTRLEFDNRFFKALGDSATANLRLIRENKDAEERNNQLTAAAKAAGTEADPSELSVVKTDEEILNALAEVAKPYFADFYARAEENNRSVHRVNTIEEVYAWFEGNAADGEAAFDPVAFASANENIDEILEYQEVEKILEYLASIYQPPVAGKKVGKGTVTLKPDPPHDAFEAYYKQLLSDHKTEDAAGSWYEFMSVVNILAHQDMADGYRISGSGQAKDWYKAAVDETRYFTALDELRNNAEEREEEQERDNFLIGLIALCNEAAEGKEVDYRGFLKAGLERLQSEYPDEPLAQDEYVYLLSVRDLVRTLMPVDEAAAEEEPAEAVSEEAGVPESEASLEAAAAETGLAEAELSSVEASVEAIEVTVEFDDTTAEAAQEALIAKLAKQKGRFDGSYSKILSKMNSKQQELSRTDPTHRKQSFDIKLAEEAQNRATIGGGVSVFWAFVARYLMIFLIGLGLILLAVIAKRVMNNILLKQAINRTSASEKAIGGEPPQERDLQDDKSDLLLRVSHLKQYFRSGSYINKAVDDISFYVKKGEVFGLVGESGCGKTTTGRTIINLYDPTEGDVYFEGLRISSNLNGYPVLRRSLNAEFEQAKAAAKAEKKKQLEEHPDDRAAILAGYREKIAALKAELRKNKSDAETNAMLSQIEQKRATHFYREKRKAELTRAFEQESAQLTGEALEDRKRRYRQDLKVAGKDNIMSRMQMIFQDPIASINPRMTVREIIAEGLVIQGVKDKRYIHDEVNRMLELVGLVPEHADRYPHEFSGGQRQRIGIARAIIMKPDLIIADEPISALDVSIQAQVINLLNDLRDKMGLTIMFIAHNLSVVKYFSDRIAVMYYGKIVEMTTSDELFAHPLHPYTKSLLSAIPYPDPHYEKARKRIEYVPAKVHDYSVDKPTLREIVPGHFIYCNDAEFAKYKEELGQ